MGSPEDIRDMLLFQQGDDDAFCRLFERYKGPLVHYLYRLTSNRAVAEELMQEVFLRVCRAAATYEPRTAFRTWLYRIATNVARNEMRRREHLVRKEPLGQKALGRADGLGGMYNDPIVESPEGVAGARQMEEAIQEVLSRMPGRQRAALLLCRHHGLSYQEIAGVMNLRTGAVKSLIHRATETLRRQLRPYLEIEIQEGEQDAMQEGQEESHRPS